MCNLNAVDVTIVADHRASEHAVLTHAIALDDKTAFLVEVVRFGVSLFRGEHDLVCQGVVHGRFAVKLGRCVPGGPVSQRFDSGLALCGRFACAVEDAVAIHEMRFPRDIVLDTASDLTHAVERDDVEAIG